MCLQSHLQTSSLTSQKSYLKVWHPRPSFENTPFLLSFFNWNVLLSITQDHMQKIKILQQFFIFFTPQYELKYFLFICYLLVTQVRTTCKKLKSYDIFSIFSPRISHSAGGRGGGGGGLDFFLLECYSFVNSGPHAKIKILR